MGNERRENINSHGSKGCQSVEDEEIEEKMDKFYALIRCFRDARDRRRNELLEEMEINNNNQKQQQQQQSQIIIKKRKAAEAEQQSVISLVPSFRMEDFTPQPLEKEKEAHEFNRKRTPPLIFPPAAPSSINIHQPDQDESGLDLKLAL